jgi:hypothetical protein
MPVGPKQLPEATGTRIATIADALSRERGGPDRVDAADLRQRLADPNGRLGKLFADWQAARMAAKSSAAKPASPKRPSPKPALATSASPKPACPKRAKPGRARRVMHSHDGSMVATARQEVEDERRGRLVNRLGREAADEIVRHAQAAEKARKKADAAPDLSTAAGRLKAALDGTARPGAPPRRRKKPTDWRGAAREDFAQAVARLLCERDRPARSRELAARFFAPTTYPLTEKAQHDRVVAALKGCRIVMTGAEWWFEGEAKPRGRKGDTFGDLYLAAAIETLREAGGREMSATEIEAAHGDAHLAMSRQGWLGDALRHEAARFAAAASGPAGKKKDTDRNKKKGTAAAVPHDGVTVEGGIEKAGELYRWRERRRRP